MFALRTGNSYACRNGFDFPIISMCFRFFLSFRRKSMLCFRFSGETNCQTDHCMTNNKEKTKSMHSFSPIAQNQPENTQKKPHCSHLHNGHIFIAIIFVHNSILWHLSSNSASMRNVSNEICLIVVFEIMYFLYTYRAHYVIAGCVFSPIYDCHRRCITRIAVQCRGCIAHMRLPF